MLLDLDKWNPFRFLRSHPAQQSASGGAGAPNTKSAKREVKCATDWRHANG